MTEKVQNGDITIVYKPTKTMWSDYHTKGLTGELFLKHRETLMGLQPEYEISLYEKYKNNKP